MISNPLDKYTSLILIFIISWKISIVSEELSLNPSIQKFKLKILS